MVKKSLGGCLRHICKLAAVQTAHELGDRQLLERFVAEKDEAAFAVLVERHGPMVLGVCRRMLGSTHDAEDACQATFLVLAQKAASIRKSTSLPSWLHGVASQVAAHLKREHLRRGRRERESQGPAVADPAAEVSWREVSTRCRSWVRRRCRSPLTAGGENSIMVQNLADRGRGPSGRERGMAGLEDAGREHEVEPASPRRTRLGVVLFVCYCVVYGGFVLANAFAPRAMEETPLAGVNLAVLLGLGVIAAAFLVALYYEWLCRREGGR